MKQIEHVLLHPICVLMFACKNCNIKLLLNTVADEFVTSNKDRFDAIFQTLTYTPRSTKKQICVETKLSGSPGHMAEKRDYVH